jgi:hypothetical protein
MGGGEYLSGPNTTVGGQPADLRRQAVKHESRATSKRRFAGFTQQQLYANARNPGIASAAHARKASRCHP